MTENLFDVVESSSFRYILRTAKGVTFLISSIIVFFIMKPFVSTEPLFLICYFLANLVISSFILHFGGIVSYMSSLSSPKPKESDRVGEEKTKRHSGLARFAKDCVKLMRKLGFKLAFMITVREIFFSTLDSLFEISVVWLIGTWAMATIGVYAGFNVFSPTFSLVDFATLMSLIEIVFGFSKYAVDRSKEKIIGTGNQLALYTTKLVVDLISYKGFLEFLEKNNSGLEKEIIEYVESGRTYNVQQKGMRATTLSTKNFSEFAKLDVTLMFCAIEERAKENDKIEQREPLLKLTTHNLREAYNNFFKEKKETAKKEIDSDIMNNRDYFLQTRSLLLSHVTLLDDAVAEVLENPKSKRKKKGQEDLETFEDFYEDFQKYCVKILMGTIVMLSANSEER